jgi:hypothetical protein
MAAAGTAAATAVAAWTWQKPPSALPTIHIADVSSWATVPDPTGKPVRYVLRDDYVLLVLSDIPALVEARLKELLRSCNFDRKAKAVRASGLLVLTYRPGGNGANIVAAEPAVIFELWKPPVEDRAMWRSWAAHVNLYARGVQIAIAPSLSPVQPPPLRRVNRSATTLTNATNARVPNSVLAAEVKTMEAMPAVKGLNKRKQKQLAQYVCKQRRAGQFTGFQQCHAEVRRVITDNPETQLALQSAGSSSLNQRLRLDRMMTCERAITTNGVRRNPPKLLSMAVGGQIVCEMAMPSLISELTTEEQHEMYYGELCCEHALDCGRDARLAKLKEAEACPEGPERDRLCHEATQLGQAAVLTAEQLEVTERWERSSDGAGAQPVEATHIRWAGRVHVYSTGRSRRLPMACTFQSPTRFFVPNRQRVTFQQLVSRPTQPHHEATDPGFIHRDMGRVYIGVERWFKINNLGICARVFELYTHLADYVLLLQSKFCNQTAPVDLTIECSPWMDGSNMLKKGVGMASFMLKLTEVQVDGDTVDAAEFCQLTKKQLAFLERPRVVFFAFVTETRNFAEAAARIIAVQLRRATATDTIECVIDGQRVRIRVKGGKLRGDFHAIQGFLGLRMSGRYVCPFAQLDASYGDYAAWMSRISEHLVELGHGTLDLTDFLKIAQALSEPGAADLPFCCLAHVFGEAPIFAGDTDTPPEDRGLDVGAIMGDPEHVLSALIKNDVFEFEEKLPEAQKRELGVNVARHVRANTALREHMDGRDWYEFARVCQWFGVVSERIVWAGYMQAQVSHEVRADPHPANRGCAWGSERGTVSAVLSANYLRLHLG